MCVHADLHLNYFGVEAPGATNEYILFQLAPRLKAFFDSLPILYGLGNAAYILLEHFLIPFPGTKRIDPAKDVFNFYRHN